VHIHGGQTPDIYGDAYPAAQIASEFESNFYRRRVLTHFLLGGVFLRHPELRLICAETGIDWIPAELQRMDRAAETESMVLGIRPREWLTITPTEFWRRNCFAGATFVSQEELVVWKSLGSNTIMWGSDFPHVETTWPTSRESISKAFSGLPNEDARRMLGLNAAHLYKIDIGRLAAKAVEISDASFAIPTEAPLDSPYNSTDYAESRVFAESTFARQLRKSLST
jgi:predicted TIM-barrel fold metal-dependent hydrolase